MNGCVSVVLAGCSSQTYNTIILQKAGFIKVFENNTHGLMLYNKYQRGVSKWVQEDNTMRSSRDRQ